MLLHNMQNNIKYIELNKVEWKKSSIFPYNTAEVCFITGYMEKLHWHTFRQDQKILFGGPFHQQHLDILLQGLMLSSKESKAPSVVKWWINQRNKKRCREYPNCSSWLGEGLMEMILPTSYLRCNHSRDSINLCLWDRNKAKNIIASYVDNGKFQLGEHFLVFAIRYWYVSTAWVQNESSNRCLSSLAD